MRLLPLPPLLFYSLGPCSWSWGTGRKGNAVKTYPVIAVLGCACRSALWADTAVRRENVSGNRRFRMLLLVDRCGSAGLAALWA